MLLVINGVQYKRKLKDWNCTKRRKSKVSKSVEIGFNVIGSTTSHEGAVITSFCSWYWKAAWSFTTYSLTGRRPYFFPFTLFPFLFALLPLPSCLAKIILNFLPFFRGRKYSKTIPACLSYKIFCLQNQLACSRYFAKWSYWLSPILSAILKKWVWIPEAQSFFIIRCLLSTTLLPRGETLIHFLPSTLWKYLKTFHQQPKKIQRHFINDPKIFKDFFALQNCRSRKSSAPENIQRLFRLQDCLSSKSSIFRKYSKTFQRAATSKSIKSSHQQQQPAKAINSSHQQQQTAKAINSSHQQQQPAKTINSSHQQQQPTKAINSSHQQQQPAKAINSSHQQQQPAKAINSSHQQQQPANAINSSHQQHQPASAISIRSSSSSCTINTDLR